MKKTRFLKSVGCLYPLVKFESHVKSKLLKWPLWGVFVLLLFCQAKAQIATANNPHGKIKIACNDCHTTKGWSPLRLDLKFKHEKTGFALEGQHAVVECKQCHASLKFTGAPKDCKSCHQDVHNGTLGQNCERCHTFQSWQDVSRVTVVHQSTRFPLLGRHQHVGCDNCHASQGESRFINMPLQCGVCHRQDYEATTNPNHQLAGFSLRCEICHSSAITGWQISGTGGLSGFDHNRTRFPLTGAHLAAACSQCHVNNQFTGAPTDCFSCHQADFQRPANPNHVASNFPHDCLTCHTINAWRPANFDHNRTQFPLTGAHLAVACDQCHVNNRFTGTPKDCFSCHQSDFQSTANPNHVAANFSQICTSCHTTSAWKPATFDHNKTRFPLLGAHTRAACAQCHVNNRFAGTPMDCFSCHQADFQRPTNPNHVTLNFSHDCTSCHTVNAWTPATFDHDGQYFRIYSGKHRGKWQTCATCHVNATNYKVFECILCHEHNQTKMDDKHRNKQNYQYNSQACYNCHPRV
jgi:predicted CXXCH cytochrome family protein